MGMLYEKESTKDLFNRKDGIIGCMFLPDPFFEHFDSAEVCELDDDSIQEGRQVMMHYSGLGFLLRTALDTLNSRGMMPSEVYCESDIESAMHEEEKRLAKFGCFPEEFSPAHIFSVKGKQTGPFPYFPDEFRAVRSYLSIVQDRISCSPDEKDSSVFYNSGGW
ncbi:MAG: hypothetical protein R6U32_07750 [Candidatus Woesearchaeota archaeon]